MSSKCRVLSEGQFEIESKVLHDTRRSFRTTRVLQVRLGIGGFSKEVFNVEDESVD